MRIRQTPKRYSRYKTRWLYAVQTNYWLQTSLREKAM